MNEPVAPSQVSEQARAGEALDRSNILIVDDRLDKRVVFRTILEELGQNIITATSGEEALRWLLDNECAVILLDVNMPGMDGLETAELIRARRKSAHTPIIFITAFADEMHTARGYSLGAVDYILSPVVPNILRGKVKALVQLHRLNAELKRRSDERVELVREQAARTMAEEQQRRASFLAEATQVMASSLEVDTILTGVAGVMVPFMADFAAIGFSSGSQHPRRTGSVAGWDAYVGPHREAVLEALFRLKTRAMESNEEVHVDYLEAANGQRLPGEVHAFPLATRNKAGGALLVALGPSGRRLEGADLALAQSIAGRAASALDNCLLYAEIQNADQRKNEFLATLSHELRNPLAPMRSALHLLRSGSVDDGRARGLLETMERQVAQMSRLVEDLLDISRITRGVIELRREPIEVATAIRNALESCEGPLQAGRHQIEIELPSEPIRVMADRARLQQILENLLLNAAKYTEAGGRIVLGASAGNGYATIQVKDNGIGIAADKLPQVFELFVQVDESPERTRRGLGIGLALVKDLVTRHGGTAHANSEGLGRGSTFSVRLPLAVEERKPAPEKSCEQAACLAGRRVLVVDDNLDAAETLVMMLDTLGQQTRQCHDGRNAVELAAEFKPEVVFMDIGLPGMSGHEAASRMRKDLGLTDAYLVALSGYGTEEDKRKSLTAGFDHHLVKPLDPTALPGILATAEKRARPG